MSEPIHPTEDLRADGKRRYVEVAVQESSRYAIMLPGEVAEFTDGEDYILRDVWMTEAEFEELAEFEGY